MRPSQGFPPAFAFAARRGFWPARTLAGTFDSLVRVSRRAAGDRRASVLAAAALVGPAAARSSARGARAAESGVCKSPPAAGGPRSPALLPGRGPALARTARVAACGPNDGARRAAPRRPSSGRGRFPPGNFTCCLTLFPGCFSSFDHSTCALSVSGRYLALEGIYLPLWAALPSYPTRRGTRPPAAVRTRGARPHGALTLCGAPFQGTRPARLEGPGARGAGGSLSRLQLGPPPARGGGRTSNLGCCRFARRYWGNPGWFLFLRLLICLSSAGSPARSEADA